MSLKSIIEDGNGSGLKATVDNVPGDGQNGLVVLTTPLLELYPKTKFFTNPEYGVSMVQSASLSGAPKNIHNGNDTGLWVGSSIVGAKFNFSSTDIAFEGTSSVHANSPSVGDIMQFASGSAFTVSDYGALTFHINVDRRWTTDSVSIYGWDTNSGSIVGNKVLLEDYFVQNDFDVWQTVTIPLVSMGLGGDEIIDSIRIEGESNTGRGPEYYLDKIALKGTSTSTPLCYTAKPSPGTRYHVNAFRLIIGNNISGSVTNGTMTGLSYDKFIGMNELSGGLNIQRILNESADFTGRFTTTSDLMFAGLRNIDSISDGTNSLFIYEFEFHTPSILDSRTNDRIEITLNDDMTDLTYLRATLLGSEEFL